MAVAIMTGAVSASANYPYPPGQTPPVSVQAVDADPGYCSSYAPAGTVSSSVANVKALCERAVAAARTYEAEGAIRFGFSKLGTPYSQDPYLRATTMFDCSSFVGRAYNASGGKIRTPSGTLTNFFPYFGWTGAYTTNAYSGSNLSRLSGLGALTPGDIMILFDGADPSQSYGNNGHAVMYLGEGLILQAGEAPDGDSKVSIVKAQSFGFSNSWLFHYNTLGKVKGTPTPVVPAPGSVVKVDTGTVSGAVFGNVTVIAPKQAGYITVYPCADTRPTASSGNYVAGEVRAVFVASKTDAAGKLCIYSSGGGHITFDKSAGTKVLAIHAPVRKVDTRKLWGPALYKMAPYELLKVDTGVPNKTAIGTLTVTAADANGTAAVFPCDADPGSRFTTPTLNYTPNRAVANLAAVKADAKGFICMKVSSRAQMIWDQVSETVTLPGSAPVRKFDSRTPAFFGGMKVPSGSDPNFLSGAPDSAVLLNVTVTGAEGAGLVAFYPCSATGPAGTSSINYSAGTVVANSVLVQTGSSGRVCFHLEGARAHVIVDKQGAATMWSASTPKRLVDTRK